MTMKYNSKSGYIVHKQKCNIVKTLIEMNPMLIML